MTVPKSPHRGWVRADPGMSTAHKQIDSLTEIHRQQERGGLGGEVGDRDNDYGDNLGDNAGRDRDRGSGGKKDSTMGKLMEKAGDMMNNENLAQKGAEKRNQAGRDDY